MSLFGQQSLSIRLSALIGVFLAIFLAFALVVNRSLDRVKVTGPLYTEIIVGKDIVADVLPPPKYIIESYLVALELALETDRAAAQELIARGKKLRAEYDDRQAHWAKSLPPSELKDELTVRSFEPALEFYDVRDRELVPAVLGGNRELALSVAQGRLKEHYERHRKSIDRVVVLASEQSQRVERDAAEIVDSATTWFTTLALVVIAVVLFMAGMMFRTTIGLTRRLALATEAAKRVASGDLTGKLDVSAKDETATLLGAIQGMTAALASLVARVKHSSIQLVSTATEIGATGREQEATSTNFSASTSQIAAAVREISATSAELLGTMEEVSKVAARTAGLAEQGRGGLDSMGAAMRSLEQSTGSISGKLGVIREKAGAINQVVSTITKVADQTNLLSVNAAIEAEKAGDQGRGFLVVAREIRRLADQSAVATLDIEQIVGQMQSAVSTGVMEMDKFADEVRRSVTSAGGVSGHLGQIMDEVQGLSARIDAVNDGMRSQSTGAKQINDAMGQLTETARQTVASAKELNSASQSLRDAVGGLKEEVARFTVED